jgi:PTS system mannose-specific IIC component/fructoselysine and glucoselysine-specific PTS system IIC component
MVSAAIACAFTYFLIYFIDYGFLSWQCLNRPIVVGPIIGLLLGDPLTGITMGASLEAIFMGISAIGGSIPSDCLSGTIIAVAYAILVGGDNAVATGLALAMTIGTVMASLNSVMMALWSGLAPFWENLAQECNPKKFFFINLVVFMIAILPSSVVIFFSVAYGVDGIQAGLAACPAWVTTGLSTAGTMMTSVGFGILLAMIWSADIAVFYFVGFILSKTLSISSLGIAVIGAAIAITYFFIERDIIAKSHASIEASQNNNEPTQKPANTEEEFF